MQQEHKQLWHNLTVLKFPVCSAPFTPPALSPLLGLSLSNPGTPCPCWEPPLREGDRFLDEDVVVHVCGAKQEAGVGGLFHCSPTI